MIYSPFMEYLRGQEVEQCGKNWDSKNVTTIEERRIDAALHEPDEGALIRKLPVMSKAGWSGSSRIPILKRARPPDATVLDGMNSLPDLEDQGAEIIPRTENGSGGFHRRGDAQLMMEPNISGCARHGPQ